MGTVLRHTVRVVVAVVVALALPAAVAAVLAPSAFAALYAPGPDHLVPQAPPRPHDPTRPTAVVVVGERGAEASDVLAPYEVLATSGRFNVYTVAAKRRPVPLTGGLDLVPDLTFDDLAARLNGAVPNLVAVPALPDDGEPSTEPVAEWVRAQATGGAMVLGICNGSGVLASAGLLDGRPAAAHWLRIGTYERRYPQVDWVRGQRWVDDGDVVTTGGILSGIDGTLHVVERLAGPTVASEVAASVGWRHHRADAPVTTQIGMPDPAAILNAGYRVDPPRIGVALTDGVGEIELASVFDAYGQSLATRTVALTADGGPVRSRHGLTFLSRGDLPTAAPGLDRLLVPGLAAATTRSVAPPSGGPAPEYMHDRPGFAFDLTLTDLARSADVATARWAAKALELPTDGVILEGPAWPWTPTAFAGALVLVGAGLTAGARRAVRGEFRRRSDVGVTP